MSIEPERPIEKHLRAVAQKRREEAGNSFDLHPATRRLLHDEVTRKYAISALRLRSFLGFRIGLWPRFAIGLGSIIVLTLGSWLFVISLHHERLNTFMAKSDSIHNVLAVEPTALPQEQRAQEVDQLEELARLDSSPKTPATSIRDEPPQRLAETERAREADSSTQTSEQLTKRSVDMRTPLTAAAPAKDQPNSGALSDQVTAPKAAVEESFNRRYALARSSTSTEPSAPSVTSGSSPVLAPGVRADTGQAIISLAGNLSQQEKTAQLVTAGAVSQAPLDYASTSAILRSHFTSVSSSLQGGKVDKLAEAQPKLKSAATNKASSLQAILPSFEVEQQGAAFRVIDHDGSIYSGYLQPAPMPVVGKKISDAEIRREVSRAQSFRGRVESETLPTPAQQAYFFNVSGTNRSLNESVIFSGNLLTLTNSGGLMLNTNAINSDGLQRAISSQKAQSVSQPFLRISGKALVGQKGELQIEAVPVQR